MAVINHIILKGREKSNTERATKKVMNQLHNNHMGTKKTRPLSHESIYLMGINNDTESHTETVQHVSNFSKCSQM